MKKLFTIFAIIIMMLFLTACDFFGGLMPTFSRSGGSVGEVRFGQTFEFDNLEITIADDIGFTRVTSDFSAGDGAYVFYIPITFTNIGDTSAGLSASLINIFSPDGRNISQSRTARELQWVFDDTNVFAVGSVRAGVTVERNLHILYVEDGEYIIEFINDEDEVLGSLSIPVEFDFDVAHESGGVMTSQPESPPVPLPDSPTARRMISDEMRRFEGANAVSPEQERYLAFGPFVLVGNNESIRVFALGESGLHATRLLRDWWSVEDRESALEQVERLATATGQSPIADEIFREFVLTGNYTERLDALELLLSGFDITSLENLYNNAVTRAERMGDEALDSLLEALEADGIEASREEAFEVLVHFQFAERVNNGLEAFVGASNLLINSLGFTERELLNLPTLAAWDYGRTAIIARYGVAAGFLGEDEAWEYLKLAADSASETYSSWREFTAAHVLGRALAFGNSSEEWRDMLDFLLNHPESSFQTIDFKAD